MNLTRKTISLLFVLLIIAGLFIGVSVGLVIAVTRDIPQIQALEEFKPSAATNVFDRNGKLIAQFFIHKRLPVGPGEIPEVVKRAVIAVEDRRFYKHAGLDVIRNFGALLADIKKWRFAQGASTITQQLAKNLFLTHEKTVTRKIKEVFLAMQIERRYTKDEILNLYLNQISFGSGAYGLGAAAQIYFNKKASELDLTEAALLAGLPKSPTRYSPYNHPRRATNRRRIVLRAMLREKFITRIQYEESAGAALNLYPKNKANLLAPYFSEFLRRKLVEMFGQNMVYQGGLVVKTTLDFDLQKAAEAGLVRGLKLLAENLTKNNAAGEKPELPQGAILVMAPRTGHILAMAGGRDFAESPFNRAVQALRQPGSAFKPIIYAAAIENGATQADTIWDAPISFNLPGQKKPWKPENYNRRFAGEMTLRRALEISGNIPAIKLLSSVGIDRVIETAKLMGIKSKLNRNLSLALGTSEVILIDLVSAYNCLASAGVWINPSAIIEVRDSSGLTLYEHKQEQRVAVSPETAYILTDMLKGVIQNGTGRKARVLNRPLAGKTGTSNSYRDALFVGYSPTLTAGVWVGYDSSKSMGRRQTGGGAALPIWIDFMKQALKDKEPREFDKPSNLVFVPIDLTTGALAIPSSKNTVTAAFKKGTEPVR